MKFLSPVRKITKGIDKWLIADHLKESPFTLRKARLLVTIHLFLLLVAILMDIFNSVFFPDENPPLKIGALIIILLIYIFRRWANFNISGNLIALLFVVVLVPAVFETGGLYSDNLLWLMAAPLMALLFSNRTSGFVWLLGLLGFTFYLYELELGAPTSYRQQTLHLDELYFLITYSGLFILIVGLVLIFATGQALIIKALNEKQRELTLQKEEISKQAKFLKEAEQKLLSSNKELEHFAYAASHDLKEPLRMIGTYTQLISRKLNGHMDKTTNEYMHFVTDGVVRMDKLLTDLLDYSRLGRNNEHVKETNLNEILFVVINNLMASMNEADAAILSNQLPVVKASSTEMTQLFQNLISNSIKFRKPDEKPVIEINHVIRDGAHLFNFADNGIGIPEGQHQKVFNIFERLHSRQEYEGSGIGLATCKKIINSLGGDIWVEPGEHQGTTFYFTIPQSN